jgi:hypothetical protein
LLLIFWDEVVAAFGKFNSSKMPARAGRRGRIAPGEID